MNITIEELTALIGAKKNESELSLGKQIVVLDRGFVYVGDVTVAGEFTHIKNVKNIRYWGTKNGLGELVNGPLPETKSDACGDIIAPNKAVIHFIRCSEGVWK